MNKINGYQVVNHKVYLIKSQVSGCNGCAADRGNLGAVSALCKSFGECTGRIAVHIKPRVLLWQPGLYLCGNKKDGGFRNPGFGATKELAYYNWVKLYES